MTEPQEPLPIVNRLPYQPESFLAGKDGGWVNLASVPGLLELLSKSSEGFTDTLPFSLRPMADLSRWFVLKKTVPAFISPQTGPRLRRGSTITGTFEFTDGR